MRWLISLGPLAQFLVCVLVAGVSGALAVLGAYGLVQLDGAITARRRRRAGWVRWKS